MERLTDGEVKALGKAVGLDLNSPELGRVANGLNAILELMAEIEVPGANMVEPLAAPWAAEEGQDG